MHSVWKGVSLRNSVWKGVFQGEGARAQMVLGLRRTGSDPVGSSVFVFFLTRVSPFVSGPRIGSLLQKRFQNLDPSNDSTSLEFQKMKTPTFSMMKNHSRKISTG